MAAGALMALGAVDRLRAAVAAGFDQLRDDEIARGEIIDHVRCEAASKAHTFVTPDLGSRIVVDRAGVGCGGASRLSLDATGASSTWNGRERKR